MFEGKEKPANREAGNSVSQLKPAYDLAGQVIGLAMKVQSALGPGFLESVYENALAHELNKEGLHFERQKPLRVLYDGVSVGEFVCDFLVNNTLVVELKAVSNLSPAHEMQVVNYLAATEQPEGLLLNFGNPQLEFRKKFRDYRSPASFFYSANSVHSVKKTGFSLLEVLVAVAVLALLVVLLMGMVEGATRMWRTNENRVESYREARAALNLIASDLRSFHPSTNTSHFLTNLPGADSSTPTNAQIGFLTALPRASQNDDSLSDLCTVGYFLAYGKPTRFNQESTFNLYRYFRESNKTWTNLIGNAGLFADVSPDNTDAELLARNILDFQITPLSTNLTRWAYSTNESLPALLEIKVIALNNERTKRLASQAEWETLRSDTNSPDYLQNTRTFLTRVPLRQPNP